MPEYGSGGNYTVVMEGPFANTGGGTVKLTTISAPVANWKGGTSPYSQVVAMDGISVSSKIEIQLSADQIELFRGQDIAFTVENRAGEVTLVAVGDKPAADCVFQATAHDVLITGDSDTSVICGNTVKTTSFTKTGGMMQNAVNMGGKKLYGLKDPTDDEEATPFGIVKKLYRCGTATGDLNNALDPGWYWVKTADCTNTPYGNNYNGIFAYLEVINSSSDDPNVLQRFTVCNTGRTWVRSYDNGWKPWTRIDSVDTYSVGSVYISTVNTSPASLFGGTWEQIKDRFLLGAGSTYAAGDTGGSATHKLTVREMPSHTHNYESAGFDSGSEWVGASGSAKARTGKSTATGGGAAHNNMPPYLVVYMWKRVS